MFPEADEDTGLIAFLLLSKKLISYLCCCKAMQLRWPKDMRKSQGRGNMSTVDWYEFRGRGNLRQS